MSMPVPAGSDDDRLPATVSAIDDRPRMKLNGPPEIVQMVPYLFGFHPENSVVMVSMRDKWLSVSARFDLDAPPEIAEPWFAAAVEAGGTAVIFVVYDDSVRNASEANTDYVDCLNEMASSAGLDVHDRLLVSNSRWWSYECSDARCCPPEGTPIQHAGAAAAGAVANGLVALASRSALETELSPNSVRGSSVLTELLRTLELDEEPVVARAKAWKDVRRFVRLAAKGDFTCPDDLAAKVLWALTDVHVRDAAIGFLVDKPDPNVAASWRELVRSAPREWRAPVATIYALWCYADGNGTRTTIALECALDADPEYSLALLIDEFYVHGTNPRVFIPEIADSCRAIGRRIQRKLPPVGRRTSRR
jgi:hypothetical protein